MYVEQVKMIFLAPNSSFFSSTVINRFKVSSPTEYFRVLEP